MEHKKRVLIVDDEEIVRQGLIRMIPWEQLALEPVEPARDGREALGRLSDHPVEIVITDILMPEMDGMGLIRESSRRGYATRFIVLSGHSEFEFARSAMTCGVRHYVLKPTRIEDIIEALTAVAKEIDDDVAPDKSELLRLGAVRKLLAGGYSRSADAETVQYRTGIDPSADAAAIVVIDLGEPVLPARAQMVGAMATGILRSMTVVGAVEWRNLAVLVVSTRPDQFSAAELNDLVERMYRLRTPKVAVTYTDCHAVWDLPALYDEIIRSEGLNFYRRTGSVQRFQRGYAPLRDSCAPSLVESIDSWIAAIHQGDKQSARTRFRMTVLEAESSRTDPTVYRRTVTDELKRAADRLKNVTPSQTDFESLYHIESVETFETHVISIVEHLTERAAVLSQSPQERAVLAIKDAVQRRYNEHGLSLKEISATEVFGNVDYLSRIFRNVTGSRFSRYLVEIRMNEATRLLVTYPNLSVQDIARRVGYGENSQYFSHAFHRYFGITPSEFRSSHRDAENRNH